MERLIIDRFENDYAVCETRDKSLVNIKRDLPPEDAKEGDSIIIDDSKIILDYNTSKTRQERLRKKLDRLFNE